MIRTAIIFSLVLAGSFHFIHSQSSISDKIESLNNKTLSNVDGFIQALNGLGLPLRCNRDSKNVSCCSISKPWSLCKSASTNLETITYRLHVNGQLVLERVINLTKTIQPPPICAPVPYLPTVSLCLSIFDLSFSKLTVKSCFQTSMMIASVTVVSLDLNCLRVTNGTMYVDPPSKGPYHGLLSLDTKKKPTLPPFRILSMFEKGRQ